MRVRTSLSCAALALVVVMGGLPAPREAAAGPAAKKVADAEYPAEFRSRVRKAIASGLEHVRARQMIDAPTGRAPFEQRLSEGIEYETAAAVTWVLRRAAVPGDDPALAKAARTLRARSPANMDEAVLVLLALTAEPLPDGNPFAIAEAKTGGKGAPALAPEDRQILERTAKFVLDRQVQSDPILARAGLGRAYDDGGGWGTYLGGDVKNDGADVPTTCLALLGLEGAARRGVSVPARTWIAALDLLLGWQAPKGPTTSLRMNEVRGADRFEWTESAKARGFGWAGTLSEEPSGYDTASGAIGLVVCQDALQKEKGFTRDLKQRTRAGIRDALAWIQQHYDITKNPVVGKKRASDLEEPLYHHHWLQGLARLCIHSRMRFLGTHDWYQEGAEVLLKTQQEDGSWAAIWWENCYALLFLMRASFVSVVPVVTESEPGK